MKILHVIDNLKLGGTQNLAIRTWNGLEQRGHTVTVAVLVDSANERKELFDERETIRVGFHGDYRKPFAIASVAKRLRELIHVHNPDIVHSWLWLSDVVAAQSTARTRIPHVSHIVDRRNWQQSRGLLNRLRRYVTKRSLDKSRSQFLAVSQAAADFASQTLGISPQRIQVAYNAIEPSEFARIPDSQAWTRDTNLRLGIAARMEPEKGHEFAIRAMPILKEKGIACQLCITGEGPQKRELESLVHRLQLSDCVKFVGWVPDVAGFLDEIDVFLVPSIDSEGLPTTILEAMSAARFVVATDVGGAKEAIVPGVNGMIIKPRDPGAIAAAITRLHEDRDAAGKMAEAGREHVRTKFAMKQMLDIVEQTYCNMSTRSMS
ncbi:MAG: glycosyltransferase [Planctomycetota bacterium]|jgi:glycosyltransferase involved in cell wall biosynthesis